MNIIEKLLATENEKLQLKNTKEVEIKRLSNAIGEPFIIQCSSLDNKTLGHISEVSNNFTETKTYSVIEACRIDGKKLEDKSLMDKFGVHTPPDLLNKLLLPGEITRLYDFVAEISGYNEDNVVEIKN